MHSVVWRSGISEKASFGSEKTWDWEESSVNKVSGQSGVVSCV